MKKPAEKRDLEVLETSMGTAEYVRAQSKEKLETLESDSFFYGKIQSSNRFRSCPGILYNTSVRIIYLTPILQNEPS